MKVLVAGRRTEPGDFCATIDGELVYLGIVCARDEYGDGGCGCGRAFAGVITRASTTIAIVRDLEMTRQDLEDVLTVSLREGGWSEPEAMAREYAEEIIDEADAWPEDTELRRVQPDDELVPA